MSLKYSSSPVFVKSISVRQRRLTRHLADAFARPFAEEFNAALEAFAVFGQIYAKGVERIVAVSDDQVAEAIRVYFKSTHNIAEGAGAASLAALMSEKNEMRGKKIGVILCGGNIDTDKFVSVLRGETPHA